MNINEDASYLYTQSPRSNIKAITIADYTFIANTMQKTKMTDVIEDKSWDTQGLLVNIKSGQYGRTYKIVINGETVSSYETPDGSDKSHTKLIATDYIAEKLATTLKEAGYVVATGSSWLYIQKSAYKTATGEEILLSPSTSPKQQEDRFKGLSFIGHYHSWRAFPTTITRNVDTITLKFPTEENIRANAHDSFASDYAAYQR